MKPSFAHSSRRSACGICVSTPQPSPSVGSAPTAPRWSRLTRICRPFSQDRVGLAVLHVGDEADAAGIVLVGRVVEALRARRKGSAPRAAGAAAPSASRPCWISRALAFISPLPRTVALHSDRRSSTNCCCWLISDRGGCESVTAATASRDGFFSIRFDRARPTSLFAPGRRTGKWSVRLSYIARPCQKRSPDTSRGGRLAAEFFCRSDNPMRVAERSSARRIAAAILSEESTRRRR